MAGPAHAISASSPEPGPPAAIPPGPADRLAAELGHLLGGGIANLRRLTGGASLETWSFDLVRDRLSEPLILRRLPPGQAPLMNSVPLAVEAAAITEAEKLGVPVATIRHVIDPALGLGEGIVMDRRDGIAIPARILRDPAFDRVRPSLAFRFGEVLAAIHSIVPGSVNGLATIMAAEQIESMERSYRSRPFRSPTFELAFRWLRERSDELGRSEPRVVHGDFRMGNILVGERDVSAILDWELVHLGDPAEDIGWVTVNSWRFGRIDQLVGGVGSMEALMDGYRTGGGKAVAPERVLFWRALGSLRWGVGCGEMSHSFAQGGDPRVERGMIGRRISETELDLLDIIAPARSA